MLIWLVISVLTLAVDQISKALILANFALTDHFTFLPGLIDIVYVKNTGAAFSIFADYTWLLGTLSILFCIAIIVYMIKHNPVDKISLISAGLLLGGALGNGIDRVLRGYVVDFIEFTFITFPVFNLADVAITIGAALIIYRAVLEDKEEKKSEE